MYIVITKASTWILTCLYAVQGVNITSVKSDNYNESNDNFIFCSQFQPQIKLANFRVVLGHGIIY